MEKWLIILGVVGLVFFLIRRGGMGCCGGGHSHSPSGVSASQAIVGVEYKWQRFYFCSLSCYDAFDKDPERYVISKNRDGGDVS
jgi:YHS domain-containing protein